MNDVRHTEESVPINLAGTVWRQSGSSLTHIKTYCLVVQEPGFREAYSAVDLRTGQHIATDMSKSDIMQFFTNGAWILTHEVTITHTT